MSENNSFDAPTCVIWKLSLWAVLISVALIVILLIGPFSRLLVHPRFSSFGYNPNSQSNHAAEASAGSGQPSSSNVVWVDTETGIYHRSSGWMEDSPHARGMTESDAIRAGYRSAASEYHRRF